MAILRTPLLLPVVFAANACAMGGLPPSRTDVGTTMVKPTGDARSGLRFSTGAHFASASIDKAKDYDFGVGYSYERTEGPGGDITTKRQDGDSDNGPVASHGAYLSVDRVLSRHKSGSQRTWLGMRGEYLKGNDGAHTLSALARINWEVYSHVEAAGSKPTNCGESFGIAFGTAGIGFFAEAGSRRNFDSEASFVATLGISLRLPTLLGFAFDLCPD